MCLTLNHLCLDQTCCMITCLGNLIILWSQTPVNNFMHYEKCSSTLLCNQRWYRIFSLGVHFHTFNIAQANVTLYPYLHFLFQMDRGHWQCHWKLYEKSHLQSNRKWWLKWRNATEVTGKIWNRIITCLFTERIFILSVTVLE